MEPVLCACGCGKETNRTQWNRADKGMRKGEHYKYRKGHQSKAGYIIPDGVDEIEYAFWKNVGPIDNSDCWIWIGHKDGRSGYGSMRAGTDRIYAHRLAYQIYVGNIPKGKVIDHICRNIVCVNPAHLEVVTQRENTIRGIGPAAVNYRKKFCIKGHYFNDANTRIGKDGKRYCRICERARWHITRRRVEGKP